MTTIPQVDDPQDILQVYQAIVGLYGREIFREKRRVLGCMADMAPKLDREADCLEAALDAGVPALLEAGGTDQKSQKAAGKKAAALVRQSGLSEEESINVVENLMAAFGMKASIRPDYSQGGEIPYEPEEGNDIADSISRLNHIRWFLNHQDGYDWKENKDKLTELRRLFNYPKKNHQQIIEQYKNLIRSFQNNPYEYSILVDDAKGQASFTAETIDKYFIAVGDMPVPVEYAHNYPGKIVDRAYDTWDNKKTQFLGKLRNLKAKLPSSQSTDAALAKANLILGRRFLIFSFVVLAVFVFAAGRMLLDQNFKPILNLIMGLKNNSFTNLLSQYQKQSGAMSYLLIGLAFLVSLVTALLLVFSMIGVCLRCAKLKKGLSPQKDLDKAIRLLERDLPEKVEEIYRNIQAYWTNGSGSALGQSDYRAFLAAAASKSPSSTSNRVVVKKMSKRLRMLLILFSALFLFWGKDANISSPMQSAADLIGEITGGDNSSEENVEAVDGAGEESTVIGLAEDNMTDFGGLTRIGIAGTSETTCLTGDSDSHTAAAAVDQNQETSWQEGVDGNGAGESITLNFDNTYQVQYLALKLGNWRTEERYQQNNRPSSLTFSLGGKEATYEFPDEQREFVLRFDSAVTADSMTITVNDAYPGNSWDDTCIAEIGIFGNVGSAEDQALAEAPKESGSGKQSKSWSGLVTRDQQGSILSTGSTLDQNQMSQILLSNNATRSMYVLDVDSKAEYVVENSDEPMPASALIGVPIMFTIASEVENGSLGINDQVTFSYTFDGGRGNLKSGQSGQTFALKEMLSEALRYSDNNAINSLIDFLGLDRINQVCHDNGFTSVDMQRKLMSGSSDLENWISARDTVMMVNAVYQNNFGEINRSFLENNFYITSADSANAGMYSSGQSYPVFLNLNGITDTRYNEVGLFAGDSEVFIVAVFTANGIAENSVSMVNSMTQYVTSVLGQ